MVDHRQTRARLETPKSQNGNKLRPTAWHHLKFPLPCRFWILGFGIWVLGFCPRASAADTTNATDTLAATNRIDAVEQRRGRFGGPERGVYKAQITPHWFQNNTRFWYRNDLRDGAKEFILIDAEKGTRQPAFNHQ